MKKPQILLLNGPPRSGKDTLGDFLAARIRDSIVVKFAAPLKRATAALYGSLVFDSELSGDGSSNGLWEGAAKDEPSPDFLGISPRQAAIGVSELLLKQLHGQDVFGKLLANEIVELQARYGFETFIVTDSGFASEARVLIDRFGVDAITLLRLHRAGSTFDGDSRSYITLPLCRTIPVSNDGTLDHLRGTADTIVRQLGLGA